jgi:glutamate transport system permease protein
MTESSLDAELNLATTAAKARATGKAATSVLYDAPGPRARRLTWVGSVVAGVLIALAAWLFVYRPLAAQDQFTMELWGPFIDPDNPNFEALWRRLGVGVLATLKAAALAIVASLVLGVAIAILRLQLKHLITRRYAHLPVPLAWGVRGLSWALNALTRVCVDVLRGMPVVITIFFAARALPELGVRLDDVMWYLVVGLTAYNMIVIAEIIRSGMEGLPRGQREAAASLGLSPAQTTTLVLLPQAVRIMLPALISQLVVVLKDTSLGFIISYNELLNIGKLAVLRLHNPLQMYFVIGLIYLGFNYALSRLADWTQRRLARGRA